MLRLIVLAALCPLAGCGAYFESAEEISDLHVEGALPLGVWEVDNNVMVLADGPSDADAFCLEIDHSTHLKGSVVTIPTANTSLAIVSDISAHSIEGVQSVSGTQIFTLEPSSFDDRLIIGAPFSSVHRGAELPFASLCAETVPHGSFDPENAIGEHRLCLSDNLDVNQISDWINVHTTKSGRDITEFARVIGTHRGQCAEAH
ncbi:MAG: hypothetical protein AAF269_08885 [Pseudomonadota bacterium]